VSPISLVVDMSTKLIADDLSERTKKLILVVLVLEGFNYTHVAIGQRGIIINS
jgi:hypothetical protein